mmetsp:Transcript_5927/g.16869  ORF Transcript_5927/g.16869 Transcript_5927/m.16869 type:complete len:903 (+) Transcript_5927:395-3103(+)
MALSPAERRRNSWRAKRKPVDIIIPILALGGLYWFSASFFLAKRSLPFMSECNEAGTLLREVLLLTREEADVALDYVDANDNRNGCWLPRKIDSLVILVVDALRFDFARDHLPLSVGARISTKNTNRTTASQLLQFVADPPTVTMQRLKGLTTGSLPTFADISGSLGGASIEEDSWVEQLKRTPHSKRGLSYPSKLGFVGDDTWADLYPRQFDESYPFPSFNTRDLDTVDNGCLDRLPKLLKNLRMNGTTPDELEVIVSHFLGVDHVGHTYGPHDKHMAEKLNQMDVALSTTLDVLDTSQKCHLALIFGDHGMTEDGNHGGGTENEINAALFVHFSPACGDMSLDLTPSMGSKYIENAFQSIHQMDLVPTISVLLGLPIPYANLGGVVPSLIGSKAVSETAAALALNAAQVWRYFTVYSETANKLPNLPELQIHLREAVGAYKQALSQQKDEANDSNAFYKACGLFKTFLAEAMELGHAVWTRFDTVGMIIGGSVLFLVLIMSIVSLFFANGNSRVPRNQYVENGLCATFVVFQSGVLSFSNSYIEAEQRIVMFMFQILGLAVFVRMQGVKAGGNVRVIPYISFFTPALSRFGELFVSGHGLDPSIRQHIAHHPIMFLGSLVGLMILRTSFYHSFFQKTKTALVHTVVDCIILLCLSLSWLEKRNLDQTRNGYGAMRIAIALLLTCTPIAIVQALPLAKKKNREGTKVETRNPRDDILARALDVVFKLLLAVMVVTGPSTATTTLFFFFQAWMMYLLAGASGFYEVSTPIQATLWRFLIRHTFFATNHGCAFNRLQYSAAFVATMEFDFALGGLQLATNTFGWEIIGLILVGITSYMHEKKTLWSWYCFFGLVESFCNCISVSLLRRHLMVWAVYAPRFLFASIFFIFNCAGQVLVYIFPGL